MSRGLRETCSHLYLTHLGSFSNPSRSKERVIYRERSQALVTCAFLSVQFTVGIERVLMWGHSEVVHCCPDFEFLKAAKPRNFSKLAILLWDPKLGLDGWFIVKNLAGASGTC